MHQTNLFKTTAVRLSLRYAFLYSILTGIALAVLFFVTSNYVDLQLEAGLRSEFNRLHGIFDNKGPSKLTTTIEQRSLAATTGGRFYILTDKDGRKLAGNLLQWPPETNITLDGRVHTVWIDDDAIPGGHHDEDAYWPLIAGRLPDGSRLLIAQSVRQAEEFQMFSLYVMAAIFFMTVILALAMGVTMGNSILRRIDNITVTAGDIMAGKLAQRIPVSTKDDEFDALARRLNAMLERIQQLVNGIRDVADNVAHDLRSPLNRLRNRLEVTLLERRTEQEYREAIKSAIEDAKALIATFNALLEIAQAEAGSRRAETTTVDLCQLAQDLAEMYAPVAEEQGQTLTLRLPEKATTEGLRDLLAQAISNLLENAIKYTPRGGMITLEVENKPEGVAVVVSDNGPGIPESQRTRVLERFVRLDSARHTPGNGLGLSLVSAVAKLHNATLSLEDAEPGLRVILYFKQRDAQ